MPRLHWRNTQANPGTGGIRYDLHEVQGSPATLDTGNNGSTDFAEMLSWQQDIGGLPALAPLADFPFSFNVASVTGTLSLVIRLQRVDSSNVVQASSGYAGHGGGTGTRTGTISFATTWSPGDRLRVSLEIARTGGHGNVSASISVNNASTYVDYATDPSVYAAADLAATANLTATATVIEPPRANLIGAATLTATPSRAAFRYPRDYPPDSLWRDLVEGEWELHEQIEFDDALLGSTLTRGPSISLSCPHPGGGFYLGRILSGKEAPADENNYPPIVPLALCQPGAASVVYAPKRVAGAPSNGVVSPGGSLFVWNGDLFLAYSWWDGDAAEATRHGFSIDRYDSGAWVNVVSQGGLASQLRTTPTYATVTNTYSVVSPVVTSATEMFVLVCGRSNADTFDVVWPTYYAFRITDAFAVTQEATIDGNTVFSNTTYANGINAVASNPRPMHPFVDADGRPCWIMFATNGTGYALVRLNATPALVVVTRSGSLTAGTTPSATFDMHANPSNVFPVKSDEGVDGILAVHPTLYPSGSPTPRPPRLYAFTPPTTINFVEPAAYAGLNTISHGAVIETAEGAKHFSPHLIQPDLSFEVASALPVAASAKAPTRGLPSYFSSAYVFSTLHQGQTQPFAGYSHIGEIYLGIWLGHAAAPPAYAWIIRSKIAPGGAAAFPSSSEAPVYLDPEGMV